MTIGTDSNYEIRNGFDVGKQSINLQTEILLLNNNKAITPYKMKEHDIGEFYRAMVRNQKDYLYNEDMTLRELHFVTSPSTVENKEIIDSICTSVALTFGTYIPEENGPSLPKTTMCIQAFKFLVLNTKFQVQELLLEDESNGHLVRMIAPISSYLLMEILFRLNYETILAESIVHFPLDLCDEILDIIPRCINVVDFNRGSKFLLSIIPNAYRKLQLLKDVGTQSGHLSIISRSFVGSIQELISQFNADNFLQLEKIKKSKKYERYGILLKKIIRMVKICFDGKINDTTSEVAKMYHLSFGNQAVEKLSDETFEHHLKTIDRDLINLLLKKIKEVNCNIYMEWAEFDDEENEAISLQRAIGLECYYFVKTLSEDERLDQCDHLIECLQQIASKPDPKDVIETLSIPELVSGANEGKKEHLMELLHRYNEWDSTVCDCIESNLSIIEKKDCEMLLQRLMTTECLKSEELNKFKIYCICIAKILFLFSITDIYEITTSLMLKVFEKKSSLADLVVMNNFVTFLSRSPNFSTAKDLRVVLFFMIFQPKKTLEILMKVAIGHEDFPNLTISLDDLFLLSPMMDIRMTSKAPVEIFGMQVLKDIVLQKKEWNSKKFSDLVRKMINELSCQPSDIISGVFTPYLLSGDLSILSLKSILNDFRRFQSKCEDKQMDLIARGLSKVSHNMRSSPNILKHHSDEILFLVKRILTHFHKDGRKVYVDALVKQLEFVYPIDLPYFTGQTTNSFLNIFQRYKNVCILQSSSYGILREDILRHLILCSTADEYVKYMKEIINSGASLIILKFSNKLSAFENLIRLTMESCLLALEYPTILPQDTVGFLLKCLARFLRSEICSGKQLMKCIHESLIKGINVLKLAIGKTEYAEAFAKFETLLETSKVENLVHGLDQFGNECLQIGNIQNHSEKAPSTISVRNFVGLDYLTSSLAYGNVYCLNECTDKMLEQLKKEEKTSDSES